MKSNSLPPQLVSLIHHIALNEDGWWDKTIRRLIICSIWLSKNNSLSTKEIQAYFQSNFSIKLDQAVVQDQITKLLNTNVLIETSKGIYKITEEEGVKFQKDLKEFEQIEKEANQNFCSLLKIECDGNDENTMWESFNDGLLSPLIGEMGAKTYELLSGRQHGVESYLIFQKYLNTFPTEMHQGLRKVVIGFLDPKNLTNRTYVLRRLNAHFCIEAGNLSKEAVGAITDVTKKNLSFDIFVDTNFLFSILGLHENPSNEAAQSLLSLIKHIANKINLKLFVSPITVVESKKVLAYHKQLLQNIDLTPNIADAVQDELSGFADKFADECRKTRKNLKASDYFDPYINNFVPIIRSKGLEFFNENMDHYSMNQKVIDDLITQQDYQKRIYKGEARTYEQLLHDISLWHFIKDRRPSVAESPVDAKCWIVTIDFRFIGFDAFKRKIDNTVVPICVHPASLIQILQFWIPRTTEFEEAIISNLRYPFLFHAFDTASEKVTIRILEVLSRFEDIHDLSTDVVTSILLNDALRQRITLDKSIDDQVQIVKDAIIIEHNKTVDALENSRAKLTALETQIKELSQQVTLSESQKRHADVQATEQSILQNQLKDERTKRELLEIRLTSLEDERNKELVMARRAQVINRFRYRHLFIPIVAISLFCVVIPQTLIHYVEWDMWWMSSIIWLILIPTMISYFVFYGQKLDYVRDDQLIVRLRKYVKIMWGIFATISVGILINTVFEILKGTSLWSKMYKFFIN